MVRTVAGLALVPPAHACTCAVRVQLGGYEPIAVTLRRRWASILPQSAWRHMRVALVRHKLSLSQSNAHPVLPTVAYLEARPPYDSIRARFAPHVCRCTIAAASYEPP